MALPIAGLNGVNNAQGAPPIFGGRLWRSLFLQGQAPDFFPRLFDFLQQRHERNSACVHLGAAQHSGG